MRLFDKTKHNPGTHQKMKPYAPSVISCESPSENPSTSPLRYPCLSTPCSSVLYNSNTPAVRLKEDTVRTPSIACTAT